MEPKMLLDEHAVDGTIDVVEVVQEDSGSPPVTKLRGVFAKADVPTANKRVYSHELWSKILSEDSKAQDKIKNRQMLGELDHPADGRTSLGRAAILITKLDYNPDSKDVYGEAELLSNDLENAKALRALIDKRVTLGFSSRGRGSVDAEGRVQEDYNLVTFDVVDNPAVAGAVARPVRESVEGGNESRKSTKPTQGETMNFDSFDRLKSRAESALTLMGKGVLDQGVYDYVKEQSEALRKDLDAVTGNKENPTSVKTEAEAYQKKLLEAEEKLEVQKLEENENVDKGKKKEVSESVINVDNLLSTKHQTEDDDDDDDDDDVDDNEDDDEDIDDDEDTATEGNKSDKEDDSSCDDPGKKKKSKGKGKGLAKGKGKGPKGEPSDDEKKDGDKKKDKGEMPYEDLKIKYDELVSEVEGLKKEVEGLQEENDKLAEDLNKATKLLANRQTADEKARIEKAIKDALEKNEGFEPFKDYLGESETYADVQERIKSLENLRGVSNKEAQLSESLPSSVYTAQKAMGLNEDVKEDGSQTDSRYGSSNEMPPASTVHEDATRAIAALQEMLPPDSE